jgi:hypothetical protein
MTMTHEQLSSMSAAELAIALQSGKVDLTTVAAHLNSRKLGESVADLVPLLPHLGALTGAVMLAQQSLHQAKPSRSEMAPIRRSKGSRNVTVHPPVNRDDGQSGKAWALTAPRAAWRWIVQHVDELKATCDAADKADDATISAELVKKMSAAAERAAK